MLRRRSDATRCVLYGLLLEDCPLGALTNKITVQSILDCSEANEGFYVKCGFKRAGLEMAHYY